MKKSILFLFLGISFVNLSLPVFAQDNIMPVKFQATDGVTVTADMYLTESPDAPWIILFHQAGYSRGEYRAIAPKLNTMGFNCMAVDQRSGEAVNDVENATHKAAVAKSMNTKYPDAFTDLEASLHHLKERFYVEKAIVWGSSYSASLVFILANKHKMNVAAVVAFSPGEYFTFEDQKIADFAKGVECPVFISSAKSEQKDWQAIYEALGSKDKTGFVPSSAGTHGSKALWKSNEGHEEYWKALTAFLNQQVKVD